jgi:hypothetical protein
MMKKITLIFPGFGAGGMECQAAEMVNRLAGKSEFNFARMAG